MSLVPRLLEELGQGGLAAVISSSIGRLRLLGRHDVAARVEQSFRKSMLRSRPCSCRFFRSSSRSPSALNRGSCQRASAGAAADLDLDLLGLLVRSGDAEHGLEQVGVEDQRVEVVADRVDMDVLVDQLDRLGAERVPEQLARCRSTA